MEVRNLVFFVTYNCDLYIGMSRDDSISENFASSILIGIGIGRIRSDQSLKLHKFKVHGLSYSLAEPHCPSAPLTFSAPVIVSHFRTTSTINLCRRVLLIITQRSDHPMVRVKAI